MGRMALQNYNNEKQDYIQQGDYKNVAEVALCMAQVHMEAGKMEDWRRAEGFLPPGKMHAAAAGANAETAIHIYKQLGEVEYAEQIRKCEEVLAMERAQY